MLEDRLRQLLTAVAHGEISPDGAVERLKTLPFEEIDGACLDHHRGLRKGFPEVVYGPGKTPRQVAEIMRRLRERGGPVLVTRVHAEQAESVQRLLPEAAYHPVARALTLPAERDEAGERAPGPAIRVVTAGTADIPVAEEACLTLELMGRPHERVYDVGAAGLHRVLHHLPSLREAPVVVAVAGMDGVLPGVLAGLLARPVVGVPTSTGYGTGQGGVAALLTMLNSCAPGLAVVNIDNGFGAAVLAGMIASVGSPAPP
ncbi:nickel pincer cofactor biosynthesis protein LarB [Dissulfurirhabdus thermomarina]|uniref:Nickel pincer cofactor biosynthesis protein LarB n=1 Tax=Dissulfurirhabdus thermomarina TaxID=1765737 RepID=A0A6N9TLS5_DISTH|nr:nickel pincer cofactor biosynthesis protein LarB [Dissulfurirhabdus thermomarina]NDY42232.1 nickel pincer cofactor biosynthesis protein LarB [Dissulfurirhabdus thermomarina]NMX23158.1 nickel pincer cofactor biosynthesis protein LarB [Dissulfurirhabdus thermomarina]